MAQMKTIIQLPKFIRRSSPVFKHFLQLDEVNYTGSSMGEKIMMFQTLEGTQKGEFAMMSIIRKEEAELWQASRGLIIDILASIEPRIVGIFKFQLLSIAMSEDMERFQWKEFSDGIKELGREIPIGQSRFVQYCSLLGVLTKHAIEDEARIMFDPHVQVLEKEPEELDAALEKLIKLDRKDAPLGGKRKFVFYDLSRRPMYDRGNEEQGRRLQRLSRKMDTMPSTALNEVFIIDNNGCHSLFVKSQMEMELF
ncbi:MAG: hypothetical protein KA403_04335 [Candidatus Omnitrophica bacterium]|nr:hypothetical protein [Candidatus Omnitrophota bacterium]